MTERPTNVSRNSPPSRKPHPLVLSLAGILLAATGLFPALACSNSRANSAAAGQSKVVPAHIYSVVEETTRRKVQAVGSLFAWEESALSSEVEGTVQEVLADVGDRVNEDQPLIVLD